MIIQKIANIFKIRTVPGFPEISKIVKLEANKDILKMPSCQFSKTVKKI